LYARWRGELSCGDGNCRDTQIFQMNRIVQTARGARPSIGQPFHHCIHAA
jgi:hypothetical protein